MSGEEESKKRKADDKDIREEEEDDTLENFFEAHEFLIGQYGLDANSRVIVLKMDEPLLKCDVNLGVTFEEAKNLRIFKYENDDSKEAKAAMCAFGNLISAIDSMRDLLYNKAKEFEEPMRLWVEKARANIEGTCASEQNK